MKLNNKEEMAIHRIDDLFKRTYDFHEKCPHAYLSFSGGKDSTIVLHLLLKSIESYALPQNAFKIVFNHTPLEMSATVDFVDRQRKMGIPIDVISPHVDILEMFQEQGYPALSKLKSHDLKQWHLGRKTECLKKLMFDKSRGHAHIIAAKHAHFLHHDFVRMSGGGKHQFFISEKCCSFMKKKPFTQYAIENHMLGRMDGIRMEEGGARNLATKKAMKLSGKACESINKDGFIVKHPIIDWTDDDIEEYIEKNNIELSECYTKMNMTRTGCAGCPYSRNLSTDMERLYFYDKKMYMAAMSFFKEIYIACDISMPWDEAYENDRIEAWELRYEQMRQEMLLKYYPQSTLIKHVFQERLKI